MPNVLSPEQGAKAIEDIIQASTAEVEFNEKLIPTGGVVADIPADASPAFIAQAAAMNAYAVEVTNAAAQIRLQRKANGFEDKPPTVSTPPAASPTGELEIDVGDVALFGETDVRSLRRLGRGLQEVQDFDIDVQQFMSFELVRGESSAPERKLRYTPRLEGFGGGKLTVKFDFEHPLDVSTGETPDRIVSKFTDPRLLMDPATGMFV